MPLLASRLLVVVLPLILVLHLAAWYARLMKRSAVKRGMEVGAELRKPMSDEQKKVLFGKRTR